MKRWICALLVMGLLLCGCTPTQETTTTAPGDTANFSEAETSNGNLAGQFAGDLENPEQLDVTKPESDAQIPPPPQPSVSVHDK